MAGEEEWRKNADTHKMSPEEVKKAGVEDSRRPPGHNAGGVLHQRRRLPFSNAAMAVGGFVIVAAIGYAVLYAHKKPEASARDVAKVATNTARPEDTHPRGRVEGTLFQEEDIKNVLKDARFEAEVLPEPKYQAFHCQSISAWLAALLVCFSSTVAGWTGPHLSAGLMNETVDWQAHNDKAIDFYRDRGSVLGPILLQYSPL